MTVRLLKTFGGLSLVEGDGSSALPQAAQRRLVLLALAATHQAFEWGVRIAVERARAKVRNHRTALVGEHLSGPLAAWLADVPATGGTPLERLRQVLSRVPENTRELAAAYRGTAR